MVLKDSIKYADCFTIMGAFITIARAFTMFANVSSTSYILVLISMSYSTIILNAAMLIDIFVALTIIIIIIIIIIIALSNCDIMYPLKNIIIPAITNPINEIIIVKINFGAIPTIHILKVLYMATFITCYLRRWLATNFYYVPDFY